MSMLEELNTLGVDIEEALKRFMNNAALYEKMLKKLTSAVKGLEVMEYLQGGDYSKALENAHTLKGVTGNLSVTPLYKAYSDIVLMLRENNPDRAKEILADILPVQQKIISCIEDNQV